MILVLVAIRHITRMPTFKLLLNIIITMAFTKKDPQHIANVKGLGVSQHFVILHKTSTFPEIARSAF